MLLILFHLKQASPIPLLLLPEQSSDYLQFPFGQVKIGCFIFGLARYRRIFPDFIIDVTVKTCSLTVFLITVIISSDQYLSKQIRPLRKPAPFNIILIAKVVKITILIWETSP